MIRFFDILFAIFFLLILLPFMIPVILVLLLTGEHEVFYAQTRIGKGGSQFKVLKFATMLKKSEHMSGGVLTQKNDPRVLPFGKFLRKTKINELPQLINILIGQMSFIGPRPQAKLHYDLYSAEVKSYINTIPPGLTGIGSVVFRDEESILDSIPGNRDQFHDRVITPYKGLLEIWFVKHRNILTYFSLALLTAWVILNPRSPAYKKWFTDLPEIPAELKNYLL